MRARDTIFSLLTLPLVVLGTAFAEVSIHAEMLARLEADAHLQRALADDAEPWREFATMDYDEAVRFFKRKELMTPDEFEALEDGYKAKGFSLAHVTKKQILRTAHDALTDAIAAGESERDTLARIRAVYEAEGMEAPEDYQLRAIFDRQVYSAYMAGRWAQMTHPDALAELPIWIYRTAGDSRVRRAHAAMDGKAFPASSEVWQRWWPPNGWGCRCNVENRSREDIEREGLAVEEDTALVPEWPGSPATQATADRVVARIRSDAQELGALGGNPDDMNRVSDRRRRRKVDHFARLEATEVEPMLRETFVFNVETPSPPPASGEHRVDWHMYSQNLETAEQLITRLVQEPGLFGLRDRITVGARATYFGEWNPIAWPDPEVVHDDELARRLGLPENRTTAISTEYAIRLRVTSRPELEKVLAFLDRDGERGPGKTPVRRAWDVQDVRVATGDGAEPPDGERWRLVYRNVRELKDGRVQVTLSKKPLDGWEHERVTVNRSLYDVLP
jgi:SPP1 gp7 family putative phage head morphogenesis protein